MRKNNSKMPCFPEGSANWLCRREGNLEQYPHVERMRSTYHISRG